MYTYHIGIRLETYIILTYRRKLLAWDIECLEKESPVGRQCLQ